MTFEVLTQHNYEFEAQISDTRIKGLQKKDILRSATRLYRDGKIGIIGASGQAALDKTKMRTLAENALAREISYLAKPSDSLQQHVVLGSPLLSESEFVRECERLLQKMREAFPNFIFSHKFKMISQNTSLTNDNDLNLSFNDRFYELYLLFKRKGSLEIIDGEVNLRSRNPDFEEYFSHAVRIISAFENSVCLPNVKSVPLIWMEAENPLIGLFSRELDGRKLASGNSLFSRMNQKSLFSKNLTLLQDNTANLYTGTPFFDSEGFANPDGQLPLIADGVLNCGYTDKRTALEFDVKPTGSAGGEFDAVPTTRGFYPRLQATHAHLDEILGGEPAILVAMAGGGEFDSSGQFGSPVQSAFLYKDGYLVGRLPEFQVSEHYSNIFGTQFRGVCHAPFIPGSLGGVFVVDMNIS